MKLREWIDNIKSILKNWKANWGSFMTLLTPIIVAFLDLYIDESLPFYIYIVALFLIITGWIQNLWKETALKDYEKKVGDLKQDITRLSHHNEHLNNSLETFPERIIKFIALELDHGFSERITIYRYDKDEEFFIPLGRFSKNREFNKIGRGKYPKDKGFISKAWTSGKYFIEELPNYEIEEEEYINKVSSVVNIEKGVIRKLTMKSRSYFCKTLSNNEEKSIAIIVFESTEERFSVSEEEINKIIDSSFGNLLVESIDNNIIKGRRG